MAQVALIASLIAENTLLETLELSSSAVGDCISRISAAISRGTMPLATLQLAENAISVDLAIELVHALRAGAPLLSELDLSGNPLCGVEEGSGVDDFSPAFIEVLCGWLQADSPLSALTLVDVALCGQARDGNGSYQSQAR